MFVTFLITVVCALRLYIPCVPVKFGRICANGSRMERFSVVIWRPWERGCLWEPKVLASHSKAILSHPGQIFILFLKFIIGSEK